ncbi:Imm8 family immunity protein [Actomonas aquatica]|uniref:Imm8 family immunity protein n=1 Tax=Actomonas aquatica TaxID=2866162 RepID=A0ABZ1C275_9BACT|nr:Imm8 family immunity protein [Opitutus sp. WL0086]WRQ85536.1 Imm8 family immunity protein [Opitutus sp. WL0086]
MTPVLKAFDCTDHDPIDQWRPEDPDFVDYWLCLHIGPDEEDGADFFYVNVITEYSLRSLAGADAVERKKIVLKSYSWSRVIGAVEEILSSVEGHDWSAISSELNRHFAWEFENYQTG